MDTSQLLHPKGVTAKARIAKVRSARQSVDRRESAKVKARSEGWCEVMRLGPFGDYRCVLKANQVHHMLGGIGTRGRNRSALAEHKQHVCDTCHQLITEKRLERIGGDVPLWTDKYRR